MQHTIRATVLGIGLALGFTATANACPENLGYVCGTVVIKGSGKSCFHFAVLTADDIVMRGGISYASSSENVQGRIAAIPDVGKTVSFLKGGVIQSCQGTQTTFEALDINSPAIP